MLTARQAVPTTQWGNCDNPDANRPKLHDDAVIANRIAREAQAALQRLESDGGK